MYQLTIRCGYMCVWLYVCAVVLHTSRTFSTIFLKFAPIPDQNLITNILIKSEIVDEGGWEIGSRLNAIEFTERWLSFFIFHFYMCAAFVSHICRVFRA